MFVFCFQPICLKRIRQTRQGDFTFTMAGEGEQLRTEKLINARGDAWQHSVAQDDDGHWLPARAYQDWEQVY